MLLWCEVQAEKELEQNNVSRHDFQNARTNWTRVRDYLYSLTCHSTNATITWNCGKWRRSGPFHLKAFMSVPDFMSKYLRLQPRLAGKESELQYRDEMLHLVIDTAILLPYSTEFSAIKVDPTHNSGPFFYVPFVDLWNSVDDAEKFCEHWKLNGYSLHLLEGKDSIGDFLVLRVDPNDYVRIMNSSDEHNLELEAKEKFLATWEYKQPERKYYNRAN